MFQDIDTLIDGLEGEPLVVSTHNNNVADSNQRPIQHAYCIDYDDTPAGGRRGRRPGGFGRGHHNWRRRFHHNHVYRPWYPSMYYTYPYTVPYAMHPYGSCVYFDGFRYVPGFYNSLGSCVPYM